MPYQRTPAGNYFVRQRKDPLTGTNTGADAANAITFQQANADIGYIDDPVATSHIGDWSLISLFKGVLQRLISSSTAAMSQVSANLTQDNLLLAANANRKSAIILNKSGATAYILIGTGTAAIAAGGYSYSIANNAVVEDDYRGEMRVICGPGATGYINITERS